MIEFLNFVLSSAWHFIGTVLLALIFGLLVIRIFKAFRLFDINYNNYNMSLQSPQQLMHGPNQTSYQKNVFKDLIDAWREKKKGSGGKNEPPDRPNPSNK